MPIADLFEHLGPTLADESDPFSFSPNPEPRQAEPEDEDENATARGVKNASKVSRKKPVSHTARGMALLDEMHPGCMLTVVEKRITTYSGAIVKVDLFGFMDLAGLTSKGGWISANLTTKAAMAAHMREYTNPTNTHGTGQVRVVDLLERYLSLHGLFYIIGFDQPGGAKSRWEATVWRVDQALIDQYKARKRG